MTTNTREKQKQYKISQENANRVVKKGGDEAKGTEESGLPDEERVEPDRDFRSVWSADAQAHSSTLQSWVWGRE